MEHKHKLLELRLTVDVLTLTATPIPRTLHMAMLGIRDISSLATPPVDRRSIATQVSQEFSAVYAGQQSVEEALEKAQAYTMEEMEAAGY